MKYLSSALLAMSLTFSISGCVTAPTHDTASGRPEVTIPGKSAKAVLGTISNDLADQGYSIRSRTEMNAVFEKPLQGSLKFMLSGPTLADPVYRVTLDLLETDTQTRVLGKLNIVENPGGQGKSSERISTSYDDEEHKKLQTQLNALRDKMK